MHLLPLHTQTLMVFCLLLQWDQIAEEKGFMAEVAEFKVRLEQFRETCARWKLQGDLLHRKHLQVRTLPKRW